MEGLKYTYANDKEYLSIYDDLIDDREVLVSQIINKFELDINELAAMREYIESIESLKKRLVLFMVPQGSPRPRSGNGHMYVKGQAKLRQEMKDFIRDNEEFGLILTGIEASFEFYLPTPNLGSAQEIALAEMGVIRPQVTPDFDNLPKAYTDALTGVLVLDDRQIYHAKIDKYYSIQPRIVIDLEYKTKFDCKFNERKAEQSINALMKKLAKESGLC